MVDPEWILECFKANIYVNESDYLVDYPKLMPPQNSQVTLKEKPLLVPALTIRPSSDSVARKASIAPRRSDAASVPLRPHGIFKSVTLSLFGWSDVRLEASLSYQITANGGSLVEFTREDQFACICADGSRPTREGIRLVSQRWVTDCLAQNELIDPNIKVIYTPSYSQLPLLLTSKACVYVTEKDQQKFEAIAEISKLCGMRVVSRNETRTPLSAVTHFIFHDIISVNRRRDLIPVALKAGKHIVSFDWLKDSYLFGSKQDETKYDLSTVLESPAICPSPSSPTDDAPYLHGLHLIITCDDIARKCASLGASIVEDANHACSSSFIRVSSVASCACPTLTETWITECILQKRVIDKNSYIVRYEECIDHLMAAKDHKGEIKWGNKQADCLASTFKQD